MWFAVCKGLGGPVGALLAGDKDFMVKARRAAKMLGGGMRQAGLIAAPAIMALKDPYPVHRRDHRLAKRLAIGLAAIDEASSGRARPNQHRQLLRQQICPRCSGAHRALKERGILANAKGAKMRFVTHYDVDEAAVDAAIAAFAEVHRTFHKAARA